MADSGGAAIDKLSIEIGASADAAVKKINEVAHALRNLKKEQTASGAKQTVVAQMKEMGADAVQAMSKVDLLRMKLAALRQELGTKMSLGKLDAKGFANAALHIKNVQAQIDKATQEAAKKAQKEAEGTKPVKAEAAPVKSGMEKSSEGSSGNVKKQIEWTYSLRENIRLAANEWLHVNDNMKKVMHALSEVNSRTKLVISIFRSVAGAALNVAGAIAKWTLDKATSLLKNAHNIMKRLVKTAADVAKKIGSMFTNLRVFQGFQNILKSFGRIAFYRVIRSAIKAITDAFKEGSENAYWYAREFGNATRYISDAYDQMSSSSFKMKNQLGAAWATLIATIQPIIQKIIELVTRAANILTQFFALLGGKTSYLKAIDYNKQWADSAGGAAKAAKEWKNQLMGFDEINRLEEPSDGGGGLPDYENMFEETPLDNELFKQIRDMINSGQWEELGELLGEKVNSIVNSIDFKAIGKIIGEKINNAIRLSYSFLKTVDFQNIGTKIADLLNNALAGIDFKKLGGLTMRIRTALWDVIYGAVVGLNWVEVARKLSDYIIGALQELTEWIKGLNSDNLSQSFNDFFGNVKWDEIAAAAVTFLKTAFQKLSDILAKSDLEGALRNIGSLVKTIIQEGIFNEDFSVLFSILQYKIESAIFGEKWTNWDWKHSFGKSKGKDVVLGMIEGMESEKRNLEKEMEVVAQTTVDVTERMLDIHSPSGVFASIGGNIVQGLINGITEKWSNLKSSFQGLWNGLQSWWSSLSLGTFHIPSPHFSWSYTEATGAIAKALELVGLPATIPHLNIEWYAKGGFPTMGDLFFANERGPELVGTMGGRTAVASQEQITEGISRAVFDAFMSAFSQTNGNGGDDREVRIYLDGREIAKSTTKYQRQMARAGGV